MSTGLNAVEQADRTTSEADPQQFEQWIVWRYSQGKTKKPPFDPDTGDAASVTDPETWSDHKTARQYAEEHDDVEGLGFVLTETDPFVGWDLDDVIDDSGAVAQWAVAVIARLDSYTEYSPSNTGFRTLTAGTKPGSRSARAQGDDTKIEVFEDDHYLTVTGNHLAGTPTTVEGRQDAIDDVYGEFVAREDGSSSRTSPDPDLAGTTTDADLNESLVERMCAGIREFYESLPGDATSAPDELEDLLDGAYKAHGYTAKDGSADRSEAELVLATLLVGVARKHTEIDPDDVPTSVAHLMSHRCRRERKTADGQPRKWVASSDTYRKQIVTTAVEEFDPRIWKAWSLTTHGDDYSYMTYDAVIEAVHETSDPTRRTIRNFARIRDGFSNEVKTYSNALTELVNDRGLVKRVKIEGSNRHLYLPTHEPDPPEAEYVVEGDEEREATDLNPPNRPKNDSGVSG